jgi:fructokinase
MKPLLCFGEALIDFLHVRVTSQDGLDMPEFRQFPGGAPANAAVAFSRLGGLARFAGQVGDDQFGHFLENALKRYNVDTRFLAKHPTAHTALAFVFLADDGDRSFSFYRDRTADVLFSKKQVLDEWFVDQPMFHICSNTLTDDAIASVTEYAVARAADAGCMISFDVNIRASLWPDANVDVARCAELCRSATIVKCAREEVELLSGGDDREFIESCLERSTRLFVVTDGANPIRYYCREFSGTRDAPAVSVVDTTAAGDAFTAALLRGCGAASDEQRLFADVASIEDLIDFAAQCGALTTTRAGAFPALPVFDEVAEYWTDMP